MRGHDELEQTFFTSRRQCLPIVFQYRLERLLIFPLGVIGGKPADAFHGEQQLKVNWFFSPKGAVVVKDGDPLGMGDEIG
jgi:hypothetical protein